MKYLLMIGLVIASFAGGIYFENNRLLGEPDKTAAIMLSRQAIDNSSYQIKVNSEYLKLLQGQEYQLLSDKITSNIEVLTGIKNTAEVICNDVPCSEEQKAYIIDQ